MRSIKFILLGYLFLLCLTPSSSLNAKSEGAGDIDFRLKVGENPLHMNVDRVFIYVDYRTPFVDETNIPKSLQRKNIEKMLIEENRRRFSKAFYKKLYAGINEPYASIVRKEYFDRPVILITEENKSAFIWRTETESISKYDLNDSGNLYIYFSFSLLGNYSTGYPLKSAYDPPLGSPIATLIRYSERPGMEIPLRYRRPVATTFPIDQIDEVIHRELTSIINYNLR